MVAQLCTLLTTGHYNDLDALNSVQYIQIFENATIDAGRVSLLNRITYGYIVPLIITFGIVGKSLFSFLLHISQCY